MIKNLLSGIICVVLLTNCSDKITSSEEDKILEKVYSNYKYPTDFYTEDLDSASLYYVNTLSIKPPDERTASSIELSTNNRDSAFNWTELTCLNGSFYMTFVGERETGKFFEFRRVYLENPGTVILFRVHKTSYLDRSMYDYYSPGEIIGKYNIRPFQLDEVKELIEYLIFVETYNNSSNKVLESDCREEKEKFIHTVKDVVIVYGDWNLRDEINVYETHYTIDKSTGDITKTQEQIDIIHGRKN